MKNLIAYIKPVHDEILFCNRRAVNVDRPIEGNVHVSDGLRTARIYPAIQLRKDVPGWRGRQFYRICPDCRRIYQDSMLPERSLLIASIGIVMKQAIIEKGNKEREYGR